MIHTAKLPQITLKRLTEILHLQFSLLFWASSSDEIKSDLCREWLERQKCFKDRAEDITKWLWNSKARWKPLTEYAKGPINKKKTWCKSHCREAFILLRKPKGSLKANILNSNNWERAGAQFLCQFYEDFRTNGFPKYLFANHDSGAFDSQDFLEAFLSENCTLCVCPACDEATFFTYSRNAVRTEIDHYFPKSRYPHFSCHPFNLIPLCHQCNSLKRKKDPLEGSSGRRNMEDIWLPYRESGLAYKTYLETTLPANIKEKVFSVIRAQIGNDLKNKIEVLGDVFDLPNRWEEKKHEVGDKLFRRIRNYIRIYQGTIIEQSIDEIRNCLDELLYILHEEELAKEPLVYPMIWWLAKLINEELKKNSTEKSVKKQNYLCRILNYFRVKISKFSICSRFFNHKPSNQTASGGPESTALVSEIKNWLKTHSEQAQKWQSKGQEIRRILS